jgi:anti-anti-sigma factor
MAGEMDIATVHQLRDWLAALATSGRPLIVDLDRVTVIDAAGLRVLATAAIASLTVVHKAGPGAVTRWPAPWARAHRGDPSA